MQKTGINRLKKTLLLSSCMISMAIAGCAPVNVPQARDVDIAAPVRALERPKTVNEGYEPVIYVPLGKDILVPKTSSKNNFPQDPVGPFELRGETLAGALQLILSDYDIPVAFETDLGLSRRITVTNLKGPLNKIVDRVCSLADLYCSYEDDVLVIKEFETFTVNTPPIGGDEFFTDLTASIDAITGTTSVSDPSTRTIIYTATQRNSQKVADYFKRLRSDTALIVFETYIWEVSLDGSNITGINWEGLQSLGAFELGASVASAGSITGSPISIGLPTRGNVDFTNGDVVRFLSTQGTVKTISQPQVSVLSGSEATLRVSETRNYIDSLSRTTDQNGDDTVSTTVAEVESGFTLTIGSNWDESTVYGTFEIELDDFQGFEAFNAGGADTLRLPQITERDLTTQVRIRPGDSILIAGLVTERDGFDSEGPGFGSPVIPTNRSTTTSNTELVFLLRPRVIVYVTEDEQAEAKAAALEKIDMKTILPAISAPSKTSMVSQQELSAPVPEPKIQKQVAEAPKRSIAPQAFEEEKAQPKVLQPAVKQEEPLEETFVPSSTKPVSLSDTGNTTPAEVFTPKEQAPAIEQKSAKPVSILPETPPVYTAQEQDAAAKSRIELLRELQRAKQAEYDAMERKPVIARGSSITIDMLNPSSTEDEQ